jgi:chromosome segregation ATPase
VEGVPVENMVKKDFLELVDKGIENNKTILSLKTDVSELKTDVRSLKEEQHRQGILLEDMSDNINLLVEAVSPLLKKSEDMGDLNEKVEDSQDQISIVKTTLKSHIQNKKLHKSPTR